MKWIRGLARLRLQPTDDLLGRKTFGTAVLSHPLSPNIMEHDLQPQCGPSQRAAAPHRPCPDSQVWTDISARIPANLAGPSVPEHRGPTEAGASCGLAWSTSTTTHTKMMWFEGKGGERASPTYPTGTLKGVDQKGASLRRRNPPIVTSPRRPVRQRIVGKVPAKTQGSQECWGPVWTISPVPGR